MGNVVLKAALLVAVMVVPGSVLADQAAYAAARTAAVAAVDKAREVGGEWRDTRGKKSKAVKVRVGDKKKQMSYLAAADHYAKAGDLERAMEYIGIVKFQGEAGYAQAMDQKDAKPRY